MARYESIFKLRGSIDNLVFYQLNGVNVVRKKSGFNSADYRKKASYRKVRENSSEFGHCSKSGKMIREALAEFVKDCGDRYMYQKFAKAMTEIKDLDNISERGKRNVTNGIATEKGQQILKNFDFGSVPNISNSVLRNEALFSVTLQIMQKTDAETITLITLEPDFENYLVNIFSEAIDLKSKQSVYEFEKQSESSALLYFTVLTKDGVIQKMGFV